MELSKLYELGSSLKKHRESKGLSREDVALRIKISAKNLHSIEEGLADSLPQPVFTRSFIRSYAQALDMDMEELDKALAEVFPAEVIDNINPGLTTAAREQSVGINSQSTGKKTLLLVILVLALLGGGAWLYFHKIFDSGPQATGTVSGTTTGRTEQAPGSTPAELAQSPPDQTVAVTPVSGGTPESPPNGAQPAPTVQDGSVQAAQTQVAQTQAAQDTPRPGQTAAAAAAGRAASAQADQSDADTAGPAAEASATAQMPQQARGMHRVIISATNGKCWVGATYDTEGSRTVTLQQGEQMVLDFKTGATIKLGNAPAVTITHNGKPVSYPNARGTVRTLNFP